MIERPTRLLIGAACLALLVPGCRSSSPPGADSGPAEIAAEVDGAPITTAEVDQRIKDELFASRTGSPAKLYEMRSDMLEEMIRERVLEAEAKKRGVPSSAVVDLELKELGPVPDEEIVAFYQKNFEGKGADGKSETTLEQVRPQIERYLQSRRAAEVPKRLREQAGVKVLLVEPRFEVAADGPSKGPADARVTIVEFSDFQCPYCQRAVSTVKQVLEKYPTDVRLVYRHLPLESIHPHARDAAEAAVCADEQGKFWAYHDKLFENNRALAPADLEHYAVDVGLDPKAFEACLGQKQTKEKVDGDLSAARAAGISGTPAFIVNGKLLSGAQPAQSFFEVIDVELAKPAAGAPAEGRS
jgi:protein-disulfide isomerase